MGYCIRAVIGKRRALEALADDWSNAKLIELPQGYAMIDLFDCVRLVTDLEEILEFPEESPDFAELDQSFCAVKVLLEEYSTRSKIAYIEADNYGGGAKNQGGVLYEGCRCIKKTRAGEGAIAELLKDLDIRTGSNMDAFDSLEIWKFWHFV